jgi:hypothetical protein
MPAPVQYPAPPPPTVNLLTCPYELFLQEVQGRTIGGSAMASILGLSSWGSPQTAWDRIMGVAPPVPDNPNMERGRWLEPIVAELYAQQTGRILTELDPRQPHPTFSFLHWSPDRMIHVPVDCAFPLPGGLTGTGVLEVKCQRVQTYRRTRNHGIDPAYWTQLQFYMDAAGADWGSFAVFNAEDWELLWFDVRRDDVFVDEMLVTAEAFWHNHVLTRVRPEAEDATPAALRVRQLVRDTTRANEVWREDGTWMSALWTRRGKPWSPRRSGASRGAKARVATSRGSCWPRRIPSWTCRPSTPRRRRARSDPPSRPTNESRGYLLPRGRALARKHLDRRPIGRLAPSGKLHRLHLK